ncbi:hypothetical protein BT96DRAFT_1027618 [Gymnopus androsaceus JB14]|uniref:Uncharacterized protein n=1 Tax=Gymnopus androsaceus JB14 TaxID=1447944 RepID=A0A6A4GAN0_9AGAR|nr:hypothetical protein BT96DRAFT_1027618 [Gymnopus androsaceus JB14]
MRISSPSFHYSLAQTPTKFSRNSLHNLLQLWTHYQFPEVEVDHSSIIVLVDFLQYTTAYAWISAALSGKALSLILKLAGLKRKRKRLLSYSV